jgi:hypothetical protein
MKRSTKILQRKFEPAVCRCPETWSLNSLYISADSSQSWLGAVCMQERQPVAYIGVEILDNHPTNLCTDRKGNTGKCVHVWLEEYIYGKEVEVETDHKSFDLYIFKKQKNYTDEQLQPQSMETKVVQERLQHYREQRKQKNCNSKWRMEMWSEYKVYMGLKRKVILFDPTWLNLVIDCTK